MRRGSQTNSLVTQRKWEFRVVRCNATNADSGVRLAREFHMRVGHFFHIVWLARASEQSVSSEQPSTRMTRMTLITATDRSNWRTELPSATSPDMHLTAAARDVTRRGVSPLRSVASRAAVAKDLQRATARRFECPRSDPRRARASGRLRHPRHPRLRCCCSRATPLPCRPIRPPSPPR
jgi:hypothetical protein